MPITGQDIEEYLQTRSDFELELFVYRTLRESGCEATHGGTYIDPLSGKARQYDVRATINPYRRYGKQAIECRVAMAIECKSLSLEAPLLVSRVPRPPRDSYHELVHSWVRPNVRDKLSRVHRVVPSGVYQMDKLTGKRTAQVSRTGNGGFKDDDRDPYEKWSQALASAADLVKYAGSAASEGQQALVLILPVLVVADGALWVADYSEEGARVGEARDVNEVELFVDREYSYDVRALPDPVTYRICYLHVYTRTGFSNFVSELSGDRLPYLIFDKKMQELLAPQR